MIREKINTEEILRIFNKIKEKTLLVVKSELFKISSIIFLSLTTIFLIIPLFFNNSGLKFEISQKISHIYNVDFAIRGDVNFALLPTPTLVMNDVLVRGYKNKSQDKISNFYAKKIIIKFSVINSHRKNAIKKIILKDGWLESYYDQDKTVHNNKTSEMISDFIQHPPEKIESNQEGVANKIFSISDGNDKKAIAISPKKIEIKNFGLTLYDKFGRNKEVKSLNSNIKITKEKILADGNFDLEKVPNIFKASFNFKSKLKKPDSLLEIISPNLHLNLKGNFLTNPLESQYKDFKGKIDIEISDLKSFYSTYFDFTGNISKKIKDNSKSIKIFSEISSLSGELNFSNIVIDSLLITGNGNIRADLSNDLKAPVVDVDIKIKNLDLDDIILPSGANIEDDENKEIPIITNQEINSLVEGNSEEKEKAYNLIGYENSIYNKKIDLNAEIKIDNVKFLNGEIKDVDIYFTFIDGDKLMFLPLKFNLPGGSHFRVNGVFDNSLEISKFVGSVDVEGKKLSDLFRWINIESQNLKFDNLKDYVFYSDILTTANKIKLSNIYFKPNNSEAEFFGELDVISKDKDIKTSINIESFNFDVDDYFLTSGQNIYLSPGSLTKKMIWLNNLSSENFIKLKFNNMRYKKENFAENIIDLKVARGSFVINNFSVRSDKNNLNLNLNINLKGKNPQFDFELNGENFYYSTNKKNSQENEIKNEISSKNLTNNFDIFDQFFALPSLEKMNGKININLSKFNIDDFVIDNAKLVGKLKDGNIEVLDCGANLYDGNISYKGNLIIKSYKIINGNLLLSNVSIKPIISDMFSIDNFEGVANISSSLTSTASKKSEFISDLSGEIKLNSNSPIINGYGINDLIKAMIVKNQSLEPEKILFDSSKKTILNQISGSIQIKKGDGKARFELKSPAHNGIASGKINLKEMNVDMLLNSIFLTGNSKKSIPINIATNIKGPIGNISFSNNLDQAKQYLGITISNENKKETPEKKIENLDQINFINNENIN